MIDHIEKISRTISAYSSEGITYKFAAEMVFDTLISSVPDLEWRNVNNCGHLYFAGEPHGSPYAYKMIVSDNGNLLTFYSKILSNGTLEDMQEIANEHHRAQVRAIWEGVK